jgi:hypothetical protein
LQQWNETDGWNLNTLWHPHFGGCQYPPPDVTSKKTEYANRTADAIPMNWSNFLTWVFAHPLRAIIRFLELTWRCIYPVLASAFLVVFFCGTTQGTELLKIFIAGERTALEHWSLSVGFAATCAVIWWVSRRILLAPWPRLNDDGAADLVWLSGANVLSALIAMIPLLFLGWNIAKIEISTQRISASICEDTSPVLPTTKSTPTDARSAPPLACRKPQRDAETKAIIPTCSAADGCVASPSYFRPGQSYLFALMFALLLAIVVRFRKGSMDDSRRGRTTTWRIERNAIIGTGLIALLLFITFHWSGPSAGALESAIFFRHQMQIQRYLGSVTIVLLAVFCWTLFGGIALTLWPKQFFRVSFVLLPAFMVLGSSHFRYGDSAVRELPLVSTAVVSPSTAQALSAHYQRSAALPIHQNKKLDETIPIYLVAAAGGGLRAGYWTASVLADLQDENPQFATHLFAVSGVSGGSLGAATFIAALSGGCAEAQSTNELGDCVRRVMEDIPLSPVLASALYSDFWNSLWPTALHDTAWKWLGFERFVGPLGDRAHTLEHTWETSFAWCAPNPEEASRSRHQIDFNRPFRCAPRPFVIDVPPNTLRVNAMGESVPAIWARAAAEQRALPNLIVNSTDVATGRRVLASNLKLRPAEFPDAYIMRTDDSSILNVRLSTMVHNGARFPAVSPAGRIENGQRKAVMQPWSPNAEGDDDSTMTAGAAIVPNARMLCSQPIVIPEKVCHLPFSLLCVEPTASVINPCRLPAQDVHRVVDGGYFDNSGLDTVNDLIDEIDAFNRSAAMRDRPKLKPAVIVISNSGWSYAVPSGAKISAWGSVVEAYTRAPEARSQYDLADRINRSLPNSSEDTYLFNLDRSGDDVPGLGWALSEASTNQMIIAAAHPYYQDRIRVTLQQLASKDNKDAEIAHGVGAARRMRRCILAIARTPLSSQADALCNAPRSR